MATFNSMPNSFANHQFLLNIQTYAKVNKVNQVALVSYLEHRILNVLQNSFDLTDVKFQSVQIEQRSGDLILNVMENGELQRYINPVTILPAIGKQILSGDWEQDDSKVNDKGEPVNEDGLTKSEYDKNEENFTDFGWYEIIWGTSKVKPEPETHFKHIDH